MLDDFVLETPQVRLVGVDRDDVPIVEAMPLFWAMWYLHSGEASKRFKRVKILADGADLGLWDRTP